MREGGYGHVIFEGQPGVGKRTMIWAMLRDAFGPDRIQVRTYMYFCISVKDSIISVDSIKFVVQLWYVRSN